MSPNNPAQDGTILSDVLGTIVFLGIIFLIGYIYNTIIKRRFLHGKIENTALRFSPYDYNIGDNVFLSAKGHGIELTLPKLLPEIYIDSHNDGKNRTPIDYIKRGQKLTLEGDFNNYFQVFCAPEASVLVLSILTPDLMAVLVDASEKYDVRIVGKTLQIFSNGRIFKQPEKQAALLTVAEKLISEIDHRMKSWRDDIDNLKLLDVDNQEQSVKIGKRYFRSGSVALVMVTAFFAAVFYILSFMVHQDQKQYTHDGDTLLFWMGFALFPCATVLLVFANSKGWLNRKNSN
jgi:hypothetical protein